MRDTIPITAGYTRRVIAFDAGPELLLLVRPDTDLDGRFKAWNCDEEEFVEVTGWEFTFEDDPA